MSVAQAHTQAGFFYCKMDATSPHAAKPMIPQVSQPEMRATNATFLHGNKNEGV